MAVLFRRIKNVSKIRLIAYKIVSRPSVNALKGRAENKEGSKIIKYVKNSLAPLFLEHPL
jgi:hypothetical protein